MKKFAVLMSLILTVSCFSLLSSAGVSAAEAPERDPEVVTATIPGGTEVTEIEAPSNEKLFYGYVDQEFGIVKPADAKAGIKKSAAGKKLTGYDLGVYTYISSQLPLISSGERSSTVFAVPLDGSNMPQYSWTASECGLSRLVIPASESESGKAEIEPEALNFMSEQFKTLNAQKVMYALIADHPYDMYWFNKGVGIVVPDVDVNAYYDSSAGEERIEFSEPFTLAFTVSADYAAGEYEVDTAIGKTVRKAAANAKDIVTEYKDKGDLDKLDAYRGVICDLASYDHQAMAELEENGAEVYGNPWQLVWVFDEDPNTKVVCEGYSKAFQYLCDKSEFKSDITCLSIRGMMNVNSNHMWNIVNMDDGLNYLVDLTNIDEGMIGESYKLFLAGTSGSVDSGYTFDLGDSDTISYSYDSEARMIFSDEELTLTDHRYVTQTAQPFTISPTSMELEVGDKVSYTIESVEDEPGHKYVKLTGIYGELYIKSGNTDVAVVSQEKETAGWVVAQAPGTATVTLTADETLRYLECNADLSVTVKPRDLSSDKCVATVTQNVGYNGSAREPNVKVSYNGTLLEKDKDYTVTFSDNVEMGVAKAVINGNGTTSIGSRELTFNIVPARTSKLTLVNQPSAIKLTWSKIAGAERYVIYRTANGTTKKIKTIKDVSTVTYTDKYARTNGTKYTYKIVAYAGGKESPLSRSTAIYRLVRASITSVTSPSAGKMSVNYSRNAKATGYEIQFSLNKDFSGAKTAKVTKNSLVTRNIGKLQSGKKYYVRMRSYKEVSGTKHVSAWSVIKAVRIK